MKTRYFLFAAAVALVMASCGVDNTQLDSKKINKLYNEKLTELCMDKVYTTIDTGYYELNDPSQRYVLQQLASAGVIDYKVERFAWYNKCTRIGNTVTKVVEFYCQDNGEFDHRQNVYGKGEIISYEFEEHFMVDVRIKRKYQSMLVDALPVPYIEDEDLAAPLYDNLEWPTDALENNEAWPVLVAPAIPEPPVERKDIKCKPKKEAPKVQSRPVAPKRVAAPRESKPRCVSVDMATTTRYNEAKLAENHGEVLILAYEIAALKCRNIQIFNKEDNSLAARCEVIVQSKNVTPQGHILESDIIDGIPAKVNITLTYYVDKGWVIDSQEIEVTKQVRNRKGKMENVVTKESAFPRPEIDPTHVLREYAD
ncbi:MAG: hypothetical protein II605_07370 [Paludibacteraceae bacterium]|nr:hypothetical protein [Paludibacteraceae bacterium]MBQ2189999.1 hypothetical protein [Paludibacteraceae bacterium]MBQ4019042.1 hypothetical protein [Paludibacteraceae bacterium]MBQ5379594.1 hypothetical protein [Paludibacteraceae bacterium]